MNKEFKAKIVNVKLKEKPAQIDPETYQHNTISSRSDYYTWACNELKRTLNL